MKNFIRCYKHQGDIAGVLIEKLEEDAFNKLRLVFNPGELQAFEQGMARLQTRSEEPVRFKGSALKRCWRMSYGQGTLAVSRRKAIMLI